MFPNVNYVIFIVISFWGFCVDICTKFIINYYVHKITCSKLISVQKKNYESFDTRFYKKALAKVYLLTLLIFYNNLQVNLFCFYHYLYRYLYSIMNLLNTFPLRIAYNSLNIVLEILLCKLKLTSQFPQMKGGDKSMSYL